jgi:hypothetical protein
VPLITRCLVAVALSALVGIWSRAYGLLVVHPKNAHARCLLCVGQVHPGRCAHRSAEGNGFSYKSLVSVASSGVHAGLAFSPRGLGGPSGCSHSDTVVVPSLAIGW